MAFEHTIAHLDRTLEIMRIQLRDLKATPGADDRVAQLQAFMDDMTAARAELIAHGAASSGEAVAP